MSLKSTITALVAAAPPDATIPVRWLAEQLAADSEPITEQSHGVAIDLTVDELAAKLNRGASTIRTWLARGELEGAYRNHGREWRIPLAAVDALQRSQSKRHASDGSTTTPTKTPTDLSSWRNHLPARRA